LGNLGFKEHFLTLNNEKKHTRNRKEFYFRISLHFNASETNESSSEFLENCCKYFFLPGQKRQIGNNKGKMKQKYGEKCVPSCKSGRIEPRRREAS
jgi:hypothetical protein